MSDVIYADQTTICPPHHWRVAEQDGSNPMPARCKKCGATRIYQYIPFDNDIGFNDIPMNRRGAIARGERSAA